MDVFKNYNINRDENNNNIISLLSPEKFPGNNGPVAKVGFPKLGGVPLRYPEGVPGI